MTNKKSKDNIFIKKLKLLLLTWIIYGIPVLLYSTLPYYKREFGEFNFVIVNYFQGIKSFSIQGFILEMIILYSIFIILKPSINLKANRIYSIAQGIKNLAKSIFIHGLKKSEVTPEQKVSLLFYMVKIFYVPLMISFCYNNTLNLLAYKSILDITINSENIVRFFYPLIFSAMLFIDTIIFSFGYLIESPKLKNVVKSVEPTALGWFVALACYPPFNSIVTQYVGWYSSDFTDFGSLRLNLVTGFLSLFFFFFYVWASVDLGFKASNLTNRGIVKTGTYSIIRHPAYICKNISWWIMSIPFIKASGFIALFSVIIWSFFYYMRALTEERHLMQDPDYIEYAKKVKYRFIPFLY